MCNIDNEREEKISMEKNRLVELIQKIKFSKKEYSENAFWSPRLITVPKGRKYAGKHYGYTLYIYGGHALDLYYVEDADYIGGFAFDSKYCNHFGAGSSVGHSVRSSLMKIIGENPNNLINYDKWNFVFEAFNKRNAGERKRENYILRKNSYAGDDIETFGMEFTTRFDNIVAKADLVWLSYDEENRPTFSLIEYKCTGGASAKNSGSNLSGHFRKMVSYYHLEAVKEELVKLLNMKRVLYGEGLLDEKLENINMNLGFYFTHINTEDSDGISEGYVKKRIYEMIRMNKEEFLRNIENVYVIFGNDETTKLALSRKVDAKSIKCGSEKEVWDSIKSVVNV